MIEFLNWWVATDGRAAVGTIALFFLALGLVSIGEIAATSWGKRNGKNNPS